MDPSDVLGIADRDRSKRILAAAAIVAGMVTALLSGLQVHLANQEQRANLLSARHIGKLSATIASSGALATFAAQSRLTAIDLEIRGLARQSVAVGRGGTTGAVEQLQGQADEVAGARIARLAETMGRPPAASSGVDAATRAALTATPQDWAALVAEQNRLVDRADRAGGRANLAVVGLTLVAVASALFGLAGALHRVPQGLVGAGAAFLVGGVGAGVLAVVT